MAPSTRVTHVIFDLDGTLIDSEYIYRDAYVKVLAEYGLTLTPEIRVKVLGRSEKAACKLMVEEYQLPITPEEFCAKFKGHYLQVLPTVELMPGALRLIRHLHKNGVPMAIATSSMQSSVDLKMKRHQRFLEYFHHVVCGGSDPEVKRAKPDPDIFLVCADRFPDKPRSEHVLVVEDAPNGLKAAISANMQAILIPDEDLDPEIYQHAPHVIKRLSDFKPDLFGLPSIT